MKIGTDGSICFAYYISYIHGSWIYLNNCRSFCCIYTMWVIQKAIRLHDTMWHCVGYYWVYCIYTFVKFEIHLEIYKKATRYIFIAIIYLVKITKLFVIPYSLYHNSKHYLRNRNHSKEEERNVVLEIFHIISIFIAKATKVSLFAVNLTFSWLICRVDKRGRKRWSLRCRRYTVCRAQYGCNVVGLLVARGERWKEGSRACIYAHAA